MGFAAPGGPDGPIPVPVQRGKTTAAAACAINGNTSRAGEKVFHVPGSRDYERTQINESEGERVFCSEAEAKAAGWRAPPG